MRRAAQGFGRLREAVAEDFLPQAWGPLAAGPRRALSRPRQTGWTERQARHSHQIARGDDVLGRSVRALDAEVACLAKAPRRLRPPENLFDLAAAFLTELMR